jgi:hypothetical protein
MGGGLMQLVAYGAQDIYLTGNPQITFWKVVYRRHTNFARECVEQTISGSSTLTSGNRGTVTVSRNGDLLSNVTVVSTGAVGGLGDAAITDVEVQIGGQKIDKHTAEWMQMWAELTTPDSKAAAYRAMTGVSGSAHGTAVADGVYMTQIPLQFWFCRNPGLALPLIALQYHEVKLVFNWGTAGAATAKVMCDYVYLDTDERRRFAQVSHEYLIEQLQYQTEGSTKQSFKLTLNHPVKALYWTSGAGVLTTETMKLKLNGHDRFAAQEKEYFQLRQPMEHHTAVPGQNVPVVQRPQFITPLTLAVVTHNSTVTLTAAAIGSEATPVGPETVITFKENTVNMPKVGDVLHISLGSEHTADSAAYVDHSTFQTVTAISAATDPIVTISPGILEKQIPAGYTDLDGLAITIVARTQSNLCRTSSMTAAVNMYSFALEPEEHQPSGTCNFSRIDTATLDLSTTAILDTVYALNYNVLRIMSGMGGLAYSN